MATAPSPPVCVIKSNFALPRKIPGGAAPLPACVRVTAFGVGGPPAIALQAREEGREGPITSV